MNDRILALRDKKMRIIAETKEVRDRLVVIHDALEPEECHTLLLLPEMMEEEMPERLFNYTRESLLMFKKEMESKRLAEIKGEEPTGFGTFTKPVCAKERRILLHSNYK